jgi:hypothetical protein
MHRSIAVFVAALVLGAACGDDGGGQAEGTVRHGDVESPSEVLGDADEGIEGVQAIRVTYDSPVHADGDIDYGLRPPAGGLHNPIPWNCGFYDQPVVDENVGHSLEHGAVWISFSPDLPEDQVELIHELARENPKVLAAPYEGLGASEQVVATAWARQLELESASDPRLAEFVAQYQDGDQAPEAGAGCSGGPLGEPIP